MIAVGDGAASDRRRRPPGRRRAREVIEVGGRRRRRRGASRVRPARGRRADQGEPGGRTRTGRGGAHRGGRCMIALLLAAGAAFLVAVRHALPHPRAAGAGDRPADPRRRAVRAPAHGEGGHADDGWHRHRRAPRSSDTWSRTCARADQVRARRDDDDGPHRRPRRRRLRRRLPRCAQGTGTSACASGGRWAGSCSWAAASRSWRSATSTLRRTCRSRACSTSTSARSGSIWAVLIVTGTSNAVNITDGMDGLAAGAADARVRGVRDHHVLAVPPPGRVRVHWRWRPPPGLRRQRARPVGGGGGDAGACAGFLWWNAAPARVFMGDTGSLAHRRRHGRARAPEQHRPAPADPRWAVRARDDERHRPDRRVPGLPPAGAAHGAHPPPLRGGRVARVHRDRAVLAVRRVFVALGLGLFYADFIRIPGVID